jgi:hypothetical protein
VICWPLALLALVAYPFIWLIFIAISNRRRSCTRSSGTIMGRCHVTRETLERTLQTLDSSFRQVLEMEKSGRLAPLWFFTPQPGFRPTDVL